MGARQWRDKGAISLMLSKLVNSLYICGSTSLYAVYTSAQGAMKP
jgi:hypothetical protein